MSEITKLIGDRIRNIRNQCGLSQEQLALKANINKSYMGQIERGEENPTIGTLEKIACVLEVPFQELFMFEGSKDFVKSSTYSDKILHQLHGRSQKDQEVVYQFIKDFLRSWDKK